MKKHPIYFAPLQADSSKTFLKAKGIEVNMDTLYYWNGSSILDRSSGVMHLARLLKWPAQILFYGLIIPKPIRDYCYDFIAHRRKKIMQNKTCKLPSPEENKFFLKTIH